MNTYHYKKELEALLTDAGKVIASLEKTQTAYRYAYAFGQLEAVLHYYSISTGKPFEYYINKAKGGSHE